ncbi:ImmA/IrrE family metallo-endopeptidase [Paenibacillus tyrfis]|uniref:IrrE N-terminal-like domain-containing protein n=1 Tax=Paenibacillus tyrfis TaxID=1501230 RepID=A0A081NWM5_9BACL|nr:ImmA/IrrE family metallo-endopeptidase [Paenibacillus tyrfis]KEQ22848.1 hypothetical protein ET33_21090 [Paenibacillus tyrfis]
MNLNLSMYKQSDLEKWINKSYRDNCIHYASDMDIERIANIFNVAICKTKEESRAMWDDEFAVIMLNSNFDEPERREAFFHELCHPLRHVGSQHHIPKSLMELQEIQAAHFQLYAAMPVYMLVEFKDINHRPTYIKVLAEEFKLPIPFVQKRIDQVERRINQERSHQNFIAHITPVQIRFEYMPETLHILEKLRTIQAKKRMV